MALPNRIAPQPTEWMTSTELQRGVVVMPGEQGLYLYTPALCVPSDLVKGYMSGSGRIFLWTRLQYCDVYQRRHWALIAVARQPLHNRRAAFRACRRRARPPLLPEHCPGCPVGRADLRDLTTRPWHSGLIGRTTAADGFWTTISDLSHGNPLHDIPRHACSPQARG